MEVRGKVVVVTGGARIGSAVADALAQRGCHLALSYRRSKRQAEEVVARARHAGVEACAIEADLRRKADVRALIRRVRRRFGRVDIVVHMASVYAKTPWAALDEEAWREHVDANLRSAYWVALAVAPLMQRQGAGRIILISDWVAASGRPRYLGFLPYYVSKMGVIGLTEALALELAPKVLVNAIAPGPILKAADCSEAEAREVVRATPLGRWGGPLEIAKAVLFLIETDFMTGECLRVDGGRHLK